MQTNVKTCGHAVTWKDRIETMNGAVYCCKMCRPEFDKLLVSRVKEMQGVNVASFQLMLPAPVM